MTPATLRRCLRLTPALMLLALYGCATMNQSECQTADWRTIGYEDGAAGYPAERIADHRRACAKYGISPNLDAYEAGRAQGLVTYCQPSNAFQVGVNGGGYGGVCPAPMDSAFRAAFQSGHELFLLRARVAQVTQDLESARREHQQIEEQIHQRRELLEDDDHATDKQRDDARHDLHELADREDHLHERIRFLERSQQESQRDLDAYQATLARVN
jgi:hypothetical protein